MAEARKDPLENVTYKQTPLGAKPPAPVRPIDNIIRDSSQDAEGESAKSKPRADRPPKPAPVKDPQEKLTVKISEDIVERLKNAAYWTRTPLAELAEEGLRIAVSNVEAEHGGKFKRRTKELRRGRPLGPAKR